MKGISPVIAVVLLLMITISLVAFAYIFFMRLTGGAMNQTTTEQEALRQQQGKRIAIDGVSGNAIILRNVGTYPVGVTELSVFVNGVITNINCVFDTINPGSTVHCTLSNSCASGGRVRVVSPGLTDEFTC
ncbi:MAG: archaellin/type IV pilin N-terminal domain-containing protein [Candidatus Aenigmatarchaeota archaeon]